MYAIVKTGGKQCIAEKGKYIDVEKINASVGGEVILKNVLFVKEDSGEIKVGNPYVGKARIVCRVLMQDRKKKVIAFRYRRRKDSKRKVGHRQYFTRLEIVDIQTAG